ncbi:MAG: hypothetical protein QOD98_3983 [Nocardioidaceae bacterium]|nr:hypothetical protein [Nocardioidaceae bacterium]
MSPRDRPKRLTIRRTDTRDPAWGEHEPWIRAMLQLQEAEARADAAEGLGITDAFQFGPDGQPFWSSERLKELHLMAQWGPVLPGWAWSRWVCNQALRAMHEETRDPSFDVERRAGLHAENDQVWAYRQLRLYERGALRFFVRRMAGSALLVRADQVEAWPQATMGGFEFIEADPSSISWLDLATGRTFSTPNIGSAVLLLPGDRVIGRLVPVEGGQMFEGRPLGVPPGVAQRVAEAPERWSELLRAVRPGDAHGLLRDPRPRESLVTDVLPNVWPLAVPTFGPPQEAAARAVLDSVEGVLADVVGPGPGRPDPWACLGAALLEPYVWTVLPAVVEPRDHDGLWQLGRVLAEPAATICRRAAEQLFTAA